VSAVLGYAHENGDIPKNPAKLVRKIPKRQGEKTLVREPWTAEEARHVLEIAQGTSMDLFVHFGLLFGLRRGEILGLQWADFNFQEGCVSVRRTLKEQSTGGPDGKNHIELVTNDTKTSTSARRLYLPPSLLASIQRHREYVDRLQQNAGTTWVDSSYVFVSRTGTPIFPTNMTKAFTRFLKEKNLRHIRVHDMRHTAAVLSLSAGVRIESVSQGLGHSRIDTTKGIYAPIVQTLNDEFTRGLANWLVPDTSPATLIIETEKEHA
jgi:integrase